MNKEESEWPDNIIFGEYIRLRKLKTSGLYAIVFRRDKMIPEENMTSRNDKYRHKNVVIKLKIYGE